MISFSTTAKHKPLAIALFAALFLGACASGDGTSLRAPTADQTTTTRPVVTSAVPQEESASGIELSSPDFDPAGAVPISATCAGGSILPTLTWSDVPEGTVELAITLSDQTDFENPLLIHLIGGIDPSVRSIQSGSLPEGAVETLNDWGLQGFGSPCIEAISGDGTVRDLQFRLHALSSSPQIQTGGHGNDSWTAIQTRATESAALLMRFVPEPEVIEEVPLEEGEPLDDEAPPEAQQPEPQSSTTLPPATQGSNNESDDSAPELNATSISTN